MSFADPDEELEVDSVVGAYMQVRKEAIDKAGLLDDTFFMYGEEFGLGISHQGSWLQGLVSSTGGGEACQAGGESAESQSAI